MNIERRLEEEALQAENNKDAPLQPGTIITRPGRQRAHVFSIRLAESEMKALEAAAERHGLPASTLARTWIAERLANEGEANDVQAIADALATFSKRLSALS